jgi:hypothetical protein
VLSLLFFSELAGRYLSIFENLGDFLSNEFFLQNLRYTGKTHCQMAVDMLILKQIFVKLVSFDTIRHFSSGVWANFELNYERSLGNGQKNPFTHH